MEAVTIDERNNMMVIFADDTRRGALRVIPSKSPGKVLIESVERGAKAVRREFTFTHPGPNQLTLEGEFGERPISVRLRRVDETKLLLPNRGFHWISERPFNR